MQNLTIPFENLLQITAKAYKIRFYKGVVRFVPKSQVVELRPPSETGHGAVTISRWMAGKLGLA